MILSPEYEAYLNWKLNLETALENWTQFVMQSQGLTRVKAEEIVLRKIESKDGHVRRASLISIEKGKFLTTSVFPATEKSPLTVITGSPHVQSDPESVRVGCVRFTNEALQEISIIRWKQNKSAEPTVHQVGDYGTPE